MASDRAESIDTDISTPVIVIVPILLRGIPFIPMLCNFVHQLVDCIESFSPKGKGPSVAPVELSDILDIQICALYPFLRNHLFLRDNVPARPLFKLSASIVIRA
jgi:hypothetical protein